MIGFLGHPLKLDEQLKQLNNRNHKHPLCAGYRNEWVGDYDCGYDTIIDCDECKYGGFGGRKNPEAKCNQRKR